MLCLSGFILFWVIADCWLSLVKKTNNFYCLVIYCDGDFLFVSVLCQCPTQWHQLHRAPRTPVWVHRQPRPLRTLWLWSAGDDTPTSAPPTPNLIPPFHHRLHSLSPLRAETLQNSIQPDGKPSPHQCWLHGHRPHTYELTSCLRKRIREILLLATTELLFYSSLPPVCPSAFAVNFPFVLFGSFLPLFGLAAGVKGQEFIGIILSWNRFLKLLIMHTLVCSLWIIERSFLTSCCECFWSFLYRIRDFILVINRQKYSKSLWIHSRREKEIFVELLCKIIKPTLLQLLHFLWVWTLTGEFWVLYGISLLPRK